jgi:hypothetical protein
MTTQERRIWLGVISVVLGASLSCEQNESKNPSDDIHVEPEPARSDADRACAVVGPGACGAHTECRPLRGQRLDESKGCWKAEEVAGCREGAEWVCGLLVTVAKDPTGGCWRFPTTCLPVGWTATIRSQAPTCDVPETTICQ